MVKHTQKNYRQTADELFECVWPFCGVGVFLINIILDAILKTKYMGNTWCDKTNDRCDKTSYDNHWSRLSKKKTLQVSRYALC